MSVMNPKKTHPRKNAGTSYNGNTQDVHKAEQQLYNAMVATLFGKDTYYESTDERVTRLKSVLVDIVKSENFDFVANSIIHARTIMNIRSMPIVITVLFADELRRQNKSYPNLRKLVADVIQRADQITDMFSYASKVFGKAQKMPMAMKRGLSDAFNKFNEYSLAKYNKNSGDKFTDVMRIVHPKPASEEAAVLFDKLMNEARPEKERSDAGTLATPYTWETELSNTGKTGKSKKDVWTQLIESNKLGYMALLRNLRNFLQEGVGTEALNAVANRLSDPVQVARSKQLPFRFVNAYEAVNSHASNKIKTAISRAMDCSLSNIPKLGDNVWIVVDVSHSMTGGWGRGNEGDPSPIQTATLFAAALAKANAEADNLVLTLFSDNAENVTVNTDDSVMSITDSLRKKVYGGGTNLQSALGKLKTLGFKPDTVIVLSDMQVNSLQGSRSVSSYFDTDVIKVAIDLNAYATTPLSDIDGWYQLSGFSERLFDFIPAVRNKKSVTSMLSVPYIGPDAMREYHNK